MSDPAPAVGRRAPRRPRPALELAFEPRMEPVGLPVLSISRPRRALANASANVRPMPIDSPTDFICVPSVRSAPANFSNANLGILTTT